MLITPSYNPTGALKGVGILIATGLAEENAVGTVICPGQGIRNHTVTIAVVLDEEDVDGSVIIETASDPAFPSGGSPLGGGPIALADLISTGILELMFSEVMITALRIRVVDAVTVGSFTVVYTGQ